MLDVDYTLDMAQQHILLCRAEPGEHGVEEGLALALEAALLALKERS